MGGFSFNDVLDFVAGGGAPENIELRRRLGGGGDGIDDINRGVNEWLDEQAFPIAEDIAQFYDPASEFARIARDGLPWTGDEYVYSRRGYVIDFGFDVKLSNMTGPPVTSGVEGTEMPVGFIGHLPECVFDELTLTMTGGEYLEEGDLDFGNYVGALVGQNITEDGDTIQTMISGRELRWDPEGDPRVIERESLKLPYGSRRRVSQTYGGPIEPGQPTFIRVWAKEADLGRPPFDDSWFVQATARFILSPIQ